MTVHLTASRAVPVPVEEAFERILPLPLERIFRRRFAAIAAISGVSGQDGEWGTVGQTRTVELSDGGRLHETLTELDEPHSFAYRLTVTRGPNRFLIGGVVGRWSFEPAGTGTRITWSWQVTPANTVAGALMPAFKRMWNGYARQALEEIETVLVAD
ncbi:MAG: SRPBCC family protein [Gordonia sp. (in: high G+C Gram-positive bacteria)]|uniref:SRPBCC family protein n=1 Tax=Gordonia sp. (in: high G+C Gram-positive bacteria) TaxID=84139 RepID=UPI0039E5FAE9